jgi:hypothetical protein
MLKLRQGITMLSNTDGVCISCGKSVLNRDAHLMACMSGGKRQQCHNAMMAAVTDLLDDLGFKSACEVMPFADQRRLDIVSQMGGTRFALDISVVSPLASSTVSPAVIAAAEGKTKKYGEDCARLGMKFVPAVFDMWGNRCKEFDSFVRHAVNVSSVLHPHIHHPELAVHTRVAVGLARCVGSLLTARLAGAAVVHDFVVVKDGREGYNTRTPSPLTPALPDGE